MDEQDAKQGSMDNETDKDRTKEWTKYASCD